MSCEEAQEEEREVLRSIYEGEERFKEVSPLTYQYRIGDESDLKTFLVEVVWSSDYPEVLPQINLDAFYNKRISQAVKEHIVSVLFDQASSLVGMAMTYTLFEYAKENVEELMADHVINYVQHEAADTANSCRSQSDVGSLQPKEKKEQLTKAQKRRLITRQDDKGEMLRGWNWVDVVKHLCQSGRSGAVEES